MRPAPRKDRNGKIYYSFLYIDEKTGKRIRLKKSEHPHFDNLSDAETWAKSQEAYKSSRKAYIARKLAWRTQYYQFDELTEKYAIWQAGHAPNSFRNNVYHLEQFVFPYFLTERHASNVNDWHLLFREFRDWLLNGGAAAVTGRKQIAAGTVNNVIKSLNTFISCLSEYNLIDPDSVKKCSCTKRAARVAVRPSFLIISPHRFAI